MRFYFIQNLFSFLVLILLGGLVVEIGSYFWHRFVEHDGLFGRATSWRHFLHHEKVYPVTSLRPEKLQKYKSTHPCSWYLWGGTLLFLILYLVPLSYAVRIVAGGVTWGTALVLMHETFHIKNHWLNRFAWYKKLVELHDIHHFAPANYGIVFFGVDKCLHTFRKDLPPYKIPNFAKTITSES